MYEYVISKFGALNCRGRNQTSVFSTIGITEHAITICQQYAARCQVCSIFTSSAILTWYMCTELCSTYTYYIFYFFLYYIHILYHICILHYILYYTYNRRNFSFSSKLLNRSYFEIFSYHKMNVYGNSGSMIKHSDILNFLYDRKKWHERQVSGT